ILNKTFVIKDGSKIIFNGKPDDAELDIKALYNVKSASVRNLFDTITQDERNIRTKSFPIDLNLNITGSLKKTKVSFDISATPGTASANSDLLGRKLAEISNNENDVNNNAATLLLFNSFFPTGTSSDQRFSGASSSVTDLLLGQISNLISQGLGKLIKGASLDLVLNELETQERNFGFTYKQELIGGRLILTIGGNVNFGNSSTINATSLSQQNSNNAIAGDFMIEYLVTTDGRIRLKAYGKASNYDIFGQDRFRTGGAISFQKDFDDFRDLFKIQNKRNKPIPVLDSLPPAPPPADTGKLKETANIK
ncbi:MAG TPA: translocation/assembly module TamB domain-containing protein, partial [Chitinophagales bacterium]|nr:translocation/assembly module TamB domain-containing protein [Chitinophagales bacterium]